MTAMPINSHGCLLLQVETGFSLPFSHTSTDLDEIWHAVCCCTIQ